MNRAIFLDRDGTLNVDKNYLSNPAELVIIPGTSAALRRLMDAGYLLFIVTNQSGIGRGVMTWDDVDLQHAHAYLRETKNGEGQGAHLPPVVVAATVAPDALPRNTVTAPSSAPAASFR